MKRPALRYHGGKWRLAPWIISHFPAHRIYVEPFGGGGSVLLRKPRSYAEVYNDLDKEIVNLFRVLRSEEADRLRELVGLTPFSRDEFDLSYLPSDDPVEQARRTLARCGMGFGSSAFSTRHKTGFRGSATRSGTTPAHDWANQPTSLEAVVERLRGVTIENRDAAEAMRYHDSPETLHYCDPPYVHETRTWINAKDAYNHEMSDDDHRALVVQVKELKGHVIISGYRCDLYDTAFEGWQRIDCDAHADRAIDRVESIWLSPSVTVQPLTLFNLAA